MAFRGRGRGRGGFGGGGFRAAKQVPFELFPVSITKLLPLITCHELSFRLLLVFHSLSCANLVNHAIAVQNLSLWKGTVESV